MTDNTNKIEQDIQNENTPKFSYLFRLFSYVFSSARVMCGVFLGLSILLSLLSPAIALVWGHYLDVAVQYVNLIDITRREWIFLLGIILLYWILSFLSSVITQYVYGSEDIQRLSVVQNHRLQEKFQTKLLTKISKLYPEYMEAPKINDIIGRAFDSIGGEWSSLQRGVIIEGYVIIAMIISVLAISVSLFVFQPILAVIVLIAPIPTLYTTYVANKLSFKFTRDNWPVLRQAGYYQGILLGGTAKEIKVMNLFDFFFNKWKLLADDYVAREQKNQLNIFFLGCANGLIVNIAIAAANVVAIALLARGYLTVGELGAVFALIMTLMNSTSALFGSISNFISKKNEAAQFFEFIDLKEQHTSGEKELPDMSDISIQNLSYRYPLTDEYRLKNITMNIRKGEKIALVGENGAGKSTIIKLITGMLEPSLGEILINGINTKNIVPSSRYNALSCMFQDLARFYSFTVADNFYLGDVANSYDNKKIDEALSFAGFDGVKSESLLGKDIGGAELSGGQWQKISIARAYYRGRDFIILDEPTSNLDPKAESDVFEKYMTFSEGKTVIIATHRIV